MFVPLLLMTKMLVLELLLLLLLLPLLLLFFILLLLLIFLLLCDTIGAAPDVWNEDVIHMLFHSLLLFVSAHAPLSLLMLLRRLIFRLSAVNIVYVASVNADDWMIVLVLMLMCVLFLGQQARDIVVYSYSPSNDQRLNDAR